MLNGAASRISAAILTGVNLEIMLSSLFPEDVTAGKKAEGLDRLLQARSLATLPY
jgi:hypothetical protein